MHIPKFCPKVKIISLGQHLKREIKQKGIGLVKIQKK